MCDLQSTAGCERYLGVAPGCTSTKLQWYNGPQGNLTEWKFLPSPGPVTPPVIASAGSKTPCICCSKNIYPGYYTETLCMQSPLPLILLGGGHVPELKISDPSTGPKPNTYVIDLKSRENIYNGSFHTVALEQHYQLIKEGSQWTRWGTPKFLPACTLYSAKIRKGFSRNKQVGSAACEIAGYQDLDDYCDDNRDFAFGSFKYETPPSATKAGMTGGCGTSAVKLQLQVQNRKCTSSSMTAAEYATFTNTACETSALAVSSTGSSFSNWVLNMTGNGFVTLRAKSPTGTTLKCKGAYLAPKLGCQDAGVVLQSAPYKWSLYDFKVGIDYEHPLGTQRGTMALVAASKSTTCRRVLGISTSCTSNKLGLYSEGSTAGVIGWSFPMQGQYLAPTIKSVAYDCPQGNRGCTATVNLSSNSSTRSLVYELAITKGKYSRKYSFTGSSINITSLTQCASYRLRARYLAGQGLNGVWSEYSEVKPIKAAGCGTPVKWLISPLIATNCTKRTSQYLTVGSNGCAGGPPVLKSLTNGSAWTISVADIDFGRQDPFDFWGWPTYLATKNPITDKCASALGLAASCGLSSTSSSLASAQWFVERTDFYELYSNWALVGIKVRDLNSLQPFFSQGDLFSILNLILVL